MNRRTRVGREMPPAAQGQRPWETRGNRYAISLMGGVGAWSVMWVVVCVATSFTWLSACGSSPAQGTDDPIDCGPEGTELIFEQEVYCVYDGPLVIEEGFRCPDCLENLGVHGSFGICGPGNAGDDAIDWVLEQLDEPIDEPQIPRNQCAWSSEIIQIGDVVPNARVSGCEGADACGAIMLDVSAPRSSAIPAGAITSAFRWEGQDWALAELAFESPIPEGQCRRFELCVRRFQFEPTVRVGVSVRLADGAAEYRERELERIAECAAEFCDGVDNDLDGGIDNFDPDDNVCANDPRSQNGTYECIYVPNRNEYVCIPN